MKHVIYRGEFAGYDAMAGRGVGWSVEIWRIGGEAPDGVGELTFDGNTPAEISYEDHAKHEPVCGSSCTLQIISPGDRTYIGLYTIEAATVGVTIRRDGEVYWVGTLDPEFYEEPYQCASGYTVALTFTDLGVLDRLKYAVGGMRSLRQIIEECAERAGLTPELTIDASLMSLRRKTDKPDNAPFNPWGDDAGIADFTSGSEAVGLDDIFVRSDNFFDDDGEASTLDQVLEGILQPLALRIVQRAGRLWVYDLNGLYHYGHQRQIQWSDDSQTLSVDEVKNNAVVTWSPAAGTDKLLPEECWPDIDTDPRVTNLDSAVAKQVNGCAVFSYHLTQDLDRWSDTEGTSPRQEIPGQYWQAGMVFGAVTSTPDATDVGFSLWLSHQSRNVEIPMSTITKPGESSPTSRWPVFKIVPQFDGQEAEGIALRYPAVKMAELVTETGNDNFFGPHLYILRQEIEHVSLGAADSAFADPSAQPQMMFATNKVEIPPVADGEANIKITMEMLFDMRFNPFESAVNFDAPYNLKDREENWPKKFNFLYVPVRICYKQIGGQERTFVFDRSPLAGRNDRKDGMYTLAESMEGLWVDDSLQGVSPLSYLAYYDTEDRKERCGVFGWKTNRQCISPFNGRLQTAISKGDDGQFISYPPKEIQGPQGGLLWIEVMSSRWWPLKSMDQVSGSRLPTFSAPQEWSWVEWILCKLPQVEIVSTSPIDRTISDEDVEYRAVINPAAKDDIELSTICGSKAGGIPTARGAYFDAQGCQIEQLTRAGRTAQIEDLLIGTLYSQYAVRHARLTGEATATPDGMGVWIDPCQDGKRFIMTQQTQDLAQCCGECTIVELSPDEYKRKLL